MICHDIYFLNVETFCYDHLAVCTTTCFLHCGLLVCGRRRRKDTGVSLGGCPCTYYDEGSLFEASLLSSSAPYKAPIFTGKELHTAHAQNWSLTCTRGGGSRPEVARPGPLPRVAPCPPSRGVLRRPVSSRRARNTLDSRCPDGLTTLDSHTPVLPLTRAPRRPGRVAPTRHHVPCATTLLDGTVPGRGLR